MVGAACRRDIGLISWYNENSYVKGVVEADSMRSETRGSVQYFQRMQRKRNARQRKCWTCKRSGHAAAKCPRRLSVVEKRQDENIGLMKMLSQKLNGLRLFVQSLQKRLVWNKFNSIC